MTTQNHIAAHGLDAHRIITEAAAAHLLGLSVDTLQRLARQGKAPRRVKLSPRRVGYRLSECRAFIENLKETS